MIAAASAREARPEAVVDSAAEREVLFVGAIDVEPIRLREACRILIGGPQVAEDKAISAARTRRAFLSLREVYLLRLLRVLL
jgi:hypothetical protein